MFIYGFPCSLKCVHVYVFVSKRICFPRKVSNKICVETCSEPCLENKLEQLAGSAPKIRLWNTTFVLCIFVSFTHTHTYRHNQPHTRRIHYFVFHLRLWLLALWTDLWGEDEKYQNDQNSSQERVRRSGMLYWLNLRSRTRIARGRCSGPHYVPVCYKSSCDKSD